jgi:DNA-binding NarL/FixJ family response regulator
VNGSGGRPANLIGRERELAIARTALGTNRSHGVLLVGDPGVGKTSLARAALEEVGTRPGHEILWLVASAVEPSIPFGAFAPFVPEIGGKPGRQPDAFFLLQALRRAIVEHAGGKRLVIGVDDAHRLDSQSATLLFQLVSAEGAKAVVARRAGADVPGGVRSLWKEGLVDRIDLEPLGRDSTLEYAADLLRDPAGSVRYVGARSHVAQLGGDLAEALWRVSGGNPLYLRELINVGLQTGRVVNERDVWHLKGELAVGPRLTELLEDRLGRLSSEETNVLELVSFADPIPLTVLARLADPGLISSLQRQGLLRVEQSDHENLVRSGHPLYGESVRESIPTARAGELSRQLAEAFETDGRMEYNLLKVVSWRLDAGEEPSADLLITASLRAAERQDWNLSRRLAEKAVAGGGGAQATFALADALRTLGRYGEALDVLGDRDGEGDDEVARVAVLRALILFWGMGRIDDADEVLARAEDRIVEVGDRTWVEAVRAGMFNFAGRPLDAVAKARPLLARSGLAPRTEMTVRSALAMGLAWSGRALEAVTVADAPLMHGVQDVPGPASIRWSLVARAVAYRLAGRLADLENLARAQYDSALLLNNRHTRGAAACALGWVALPRGQLTAAMAYFREAAAALEQSDPLGSRVQALTALTEALAVGGDPDGAANALAEARQGTPDQDWLHPRFTVSGAWVTAARGEVSRALAELEEAAAQARGSGQVAYELLALSAAARLGSADIAPRAVELAGWVEGPLAEVVALHASALAADSGEALDRVADRYASLTLNLYAAETAAQASRAHALAGRSRLASASSARAHALLDVTGPRPLGMAAALAPPGLTRREQEVAMLAVGGLSSQAIASRLYVSVRTVDTHLARVYQKLGISGRTQLGAALASSGDAAEAS